MTPDRRPAELTEEQKQAWHATPFVHVFGQDVWHDDVVIVCNDAGLEKLRELLDEDMGAPQHVEVFVNDGEGYALRVQLVDDETMDKLAVPYSSEMAVERNEDRWEKTKELLGRLEADDD